MRVRDATLHGDEQGIWSYLITTPIPNLEAEGEHQEIGSFRTRSGFSYD